MTPRRPNPGDLPAWPRLLTITLAAAYTGHSVSSFRADVGRIWPQPVTGTRRRVWDRLALDQTIDRMPGAAGPDHDAYLDATRDARRAAWESGQRKTPRRLEEIEAEQWMRSLREPADPPPQKRRRGAKT